MNKKRWADKRLRLCFALSMGFLLAFALSSRARASEGFHIVISNAKVELVKNTTGTDFSNDSLAEISFTFSNIDPAPTTDEGCVGTDDPLINTRAPFQVRLQSGYTTVGFLHFPITIVGTGMGESDTILVDLVPEHPVVDSELMKLTTAGGACYTEAFNTVISQVGLNGLIAAIKAGNPLVLTVLFGDDSGAITIPAANVEIHDEY
jgi:hypothetical protein